MQSRFDSFMEALTNVVVGFLISLVVWHFVALAFGIPMTVGKSFLITSIFTVTSILRSYTIRRLFNGVSIWHAILWRFRKWRA